MTSGCDCSCAVQDLRITITMQILYSYKGSGMLLDNASPLCKPCTKEHIPQRGPSNINGQAGNTED